MNKFTYNIIVVLMGIFSFLNAENIHIINKIIIVGNDKTSNKLILQHVKHPINIPPDESVADDDKERLLNMNIFESVKVEFKNDTYYIIVKEKKLLSYAPLIRNEDIGWSVGPIININNINGKAKNINIATSMGAMKSGEIQYYNQKLLLQYQFSEYKSIESDYLMNKQYLFVTYIIKKKNTQINLTPQINNYQLKYYNTQNLMYFRYFSLSYDFLYKKNDLNQLNINVTHNISLNNRKDYSKAFIDYTYILKINSSTKSPLVIFNSKLIFNSNMDSPDFENIYIGGKNYVRGYYPNLKDNSEEIIQKLKFKNLLFQSVQLELPLTSNIFFKTNLLFFSDNALGGLAYDQYSHTNKLKGYGWGISIETINKIRFDICVGLNHFGSRTIHFINYINN